MMKQSIKCKSIKYDCHKSNGYLLLSLRNIVNESKVFFGNDVLSHSLNKKEAYLSKKKQMTELCNEWNPQFEGKYTKEMNECKSGDDIINTLKVIENKIGAIPYVKQYVNAIRKAASLREYNICFKIFKIAKQVQRIDLSLYIAMIWVCSQQRTVSSLNNGVELFIEMQQLYQLTPNIEIYNQLLSLCLKTMEYAKCKHILKDLKYNKLNITPNIQTYNIMMDLYCKCGEIHKAIQIYEGLVNAKYGDLKPNYVIYTTLISAFSKNNKVETAHKLFDECMKECYNNNKEQNDKQLLILTQCLLNGYANRGNVDKCVEIITNMIDKQHNEYDWTNYPNPNAQIFSCVLKALTKHKMIDLEHKDIYNKIDYETCWTIIEWCLQCMNALNIKKDAVIYGNLFHLTGDLYGNADLDRALHYYNEMKQNNVKICELQMFNLLKTGQQYHHHKKSNNSERKEFVKYILSELQEQDIIPSTQMSKLVTKMMGTIIAK